MITRTLLLAFAFLSVACGDSACDELADCTGNEVGTDEEACELELELQKEVDACK
jgi:hypothetical protein